MFEEIHFTNKFSEIVAFLNLTSFTECNTVI